MLDLFRNRTFVILAALISLGMWIGAGHARSRESGRGFFVQHVLQTVLIPSNQFFHTIAAASSHTARALRPRASIMRENARLRREVHQLTLENNRLREAAEENIRLKSALNLKSAAQQAMITASVVAREQSTWFDTATINRGRRAGVDRGSAVVIPTGLVGQVLEVTPFTSQIVSITDPSSAVGAMVQRSRSTGMLLGQGADYPVLSYLPKDADVKEGDVVITAGIGKTIPKGFVIGRVMSVARDSTTGTTSALVRPSVKFDQIEQVFVVKPLEDMKQ